MSNSHELPPPEIDFMADLHAADAVINEIDKQHALPEQLIQRDSGQRFTVIGKKDSPGGELVNLEGPDGRTLALEENRVRDALNNPGGPWAPAAPEPSGTAEGAGTTAANSPPPSPPPRPAPAPAAPPPAPAHEQNHQPDDNNTEPPNELPPPGFEINEDTYWHPEDGTPTKSQLTTLKHAVKDVGRGFGGQVSQIAKNDRFDPDHPNTRAPIHENGYQFARLALDYKNADEARRKEILDEELGDTGLEGSSYEKAYKEARRRLKKDLDAASKLGPQEISKLGQAIDDYRFLKSNLKRAGLAYKERNVIGRGAVKALKGGKEFLASPGTAVAATLIRLRTRKSVADPEKTGKLRRSLKAGSVAVVGAFLFYRGAAGVVELAKAGGMDFIEGATDLTHWPPFTDAGESPGLDLDGDDNQQPEPETDNGDKETPPPPDQEPEIETIRRPIGEWNPKTGEGSVWGTVRDYGEGLGLDLTDEQIRDATDKALIRDKVGGEDASYAERWEAAKRLSPEHKVTLSSDLFDIETPEIPETSPAEYIETAELGEFDDTLDEKTHYLKGTGYNAVAHELNEQAVAAGYGELNFAQLQQQPGFNSAYHDLMSEVLAYNDLDWDGAKNLQPSDKLKIPKDSLQTFLDKFVTADTAQEAGTEQQTVLAASETTTGLTPETSALPDYYEVRTGDDYRSVFNRIAENDPRVPKEIKNTDAKNQFLQDLLADRNKIARLYRGVETDAMSTSWNSFLAESIFVPQVEQNGRWFIDPLFIANATALMRKFANPESDEEDEELFV